MAVLVLRFHIINDNLIRSFGRATLFQLYVVHLRKRRPVHTLQLLKSKTSATLKDIQAYRHSPLDTIDSLQPLDILCCEIQRRACQVIHRAGSREHYFGAHVLRATLQVVRHPMRKPRKEHDERNAQSNTYHAHERANRALAYVGYYEIVHNHWSVVSGQ